MQKKLARSPSAESNPNRVVSLSLGSLNLQKSFRKTQSKFQNYNESLSSREHDCPQTNLSSPWEQANYPIMQSDQNRSTNMRSNNHLSTSTLTHEELAMDSNENANTLQNTISRAIDSDHSRLKENFKKSDFTQTFSRLVSKPGLRIHPFLSFRGKPALTSPK